MGSIPGNRWESNASPDLPSIHSLRWAKVGDILESMQGHTACQVNPFLFRLDQLKFLALITETAAFPEGGGVIIFIFSPWGNPVKYTDPDGRADEDSIDGEDIQIDPPGWDPAKSHGEGWEWRGRLGSQPGDKDGSWYNPETGQSLHPDLDHPEGVKPHWDYKPGRDKEKIRINPDTGRPLTNDQEHGREPLPGSESKSNDGGSITEPDYTAPSLTNPNITDPKITNPNYLPPSNQNRRNILPPVFVVPIPRFRYR